MKQYKIGGIWNKDNLNKFIEVLMILFFVSYKDKVHLLKIQN